jgi:hypothetical protein
MAATVIDALVVTLSLNGSQFRQGSVQAQEQLKKTENQARRSAGNIEKSAAQATEFFRKLRNQVAALSAAYLSFSGIRAWTERLNQQDAALGRSAAAMGATTEGVAALGAATERAGGSAADMTATMRRMATQVQELSLYGTSDLVPFLTRLNINIAQFIRAKPEERMRLLNRAVQGMDPQRARAILEGLGGLSEGVANLVLLPTQRFDDLIRKSAELNKVTREDTEAAIKRKNVWLDFTDSLNNAFRPILTAITPLLVEIGEQLTGWVQDSRDWLKTGIVEAVRDFRDYLKTIDWKSIRDGLRDFAAKVEEIRKAVGIEWKTVIEVVGALWLARITGLTGAAGLLLGALRLVAGVVPVAGSILALLASPAVLAAIAAIYAMRPKPLNEGEDEFLKQHRLKSPEDQARSGDPSTWVPPPTTNADDTWLGKLYEKWYGHKWSQRKTDADFDREAGGPEASSGTMGPLAELLARGEAGKAGYNAVNRGALGGYAAGMENLANKTVAEVMADQAAGRYNAAGRYQIIKGTLKSAVEALGMTGREKFDKATQDRIFEQYLIGIKRKEVADYVFGRSNDLGAALLGVSKEWASVADPRTGRSYYDKDGINRSSITSGEVADRLNRMREAQALTRQAPYGSGRWDSPAAGGPSATEVHVNGPITVNGAKDADATAKMLTAALHKRVGDLMAFNYGLA